MSETREQAHAPRLSRRSGNAETVTIACNYPNGLIMQLYHIEESVSVLPNGREIKENIATLNLDAGQWRLNGPALDVAALARQELPDYRVIKGSQVGAGYALTSGIPRTFAEEWFRQNKDSPLVKSRNGKEPIVFMATNESRAVSQAREYRDGRSGFEPLLQSKDPRVPGANRVSKYSPNDNRVTPEQADLGPEDDV